MTAPLKMAIVGCGAIAESHATAIGSSDNAELVAAVDSVEDARQRAHDSWGCSTFTSISEMLGSDVPDAAVVCTPPSSHRSVVTQLLDSGVHVLCEKPLAPRLADAEAMVAHADAASRALAVSAKFRYVDDLLEARKLIDSGFIGRPVYYEVTFCARVPVADKWSVQREVAGGGVVMDNGCHAYDVLSTVLDSPVAGVSAAFTHRTVTPDLEDTAEIQFRTRSGTLGRVALSWTYFTKDLDYLMVQGTEGGIRIGWTGGLKRRHDDREWTPFGTGYDKSAAFAGQLDAFVVGLREPDGYMNSLNGLDAVEFIEQAYRAEQSGSWEDCVGRESLAGRS